MNNRDSSADNPSEQLFSDVPLEIWNAISEALPDKATIIKHKLSMSCTTLYSFFHPDCDKRDAGQLLSYVLQGNAEEAKKMYTANPRLLFIETNAKEYAAGLDENGKNVHRQVTESPFKAAARAGDIWMLNDMIEQFGKVTDKENQKTGETLAKEQLAEIFPNGFEYPASRYDFSKLVEVISTDQVLINASDFVGPGEASLDTEKALAQFRKEFIPGSEKMGYHFNLNELIKACEIYSINSQWNSYQQGIFWSQVVGYLERLVSACDAQVLCQGIKNILDGRPLERSFELDLYSRGQGQRISYFPLSVEPSCYLGGLFAVDSNWSSCRLRRAWMAARVVDAVRGVEGGRVSRPFEKLCRLKTAGLKEFKHQLHKSVDYSEVNQDVQQACIIL